VDQPNSYERRTTTVTTMNDPDEITDTDPEIVAWHV